MANIGGVCWLSKNNEEKRTKRRYCRSKLSKREEKDAVFVFLFILFCFLHQDEKCPAIDRQVERHLEELTVSGCHVPL